MRCPSVLAAQPLWRRGTASSRGGRYPHRRTTAEQRARRFLAPNANRAWQFLLNRAAAHEQKHSGRMRGKSMPAEEQRPALAFSLHYTQLNPICECARVTCLRRCKHTHTHTLFLLARGQSKTVPAAHAEVLSKNPQMHRLEE